MTAQDTHPKKLEHCPVCGIDQIAEGIAACPNCKTDLQPILRVREILFDELSEAQRLFELGAWDTALQHAASAVSLNGDSLEAQKLIGRIYWHLGNYKTSLLHCEEAIALAPDDIEAKDWAKKSRRAIRSSAWRRTSVAVAIVLLFTFALLFFVYLPFQSVRKDLFTLSTTIALSDEYRKSHTWNNEAVNRLTESMRQAEKVALGREQQLVDYSANHSHSDSDFDQLSKSLAEANSSRDAAIASLNEFQRTRPTTREEYQSLAKNQDQLKTLVLETAKATHDSYSNLITRMQNVEQSAQAATHSPSDETLNLDIAIPGVTMNSTGRYVTLTFDNGLFQRGTLFRPEATTTLAAIARLLRPLANRVKVEIIGYTDEPPFLGDEITLGYKRALGVCQFLRARTPLSSDSISIKSGGVLRASDSTGPAVSNARNRTVVIVLELNANFTPAISPAKRPL